MTNCKNTAIQIFKNAASFATLFTLSLFVSINSFAADAEKGETLSQTCLGCHGAPGLRNPSPVYNIPMIGGQHAPYIESALKAEGSVDSNKLQEIFFTMGVWSTIDCVAIQFWCARFSAKLFDYAVYADRMSNDKRGHSTKPDTFDPNMSFN